MGPTANHGRAPFPVLLDMMDSQASIPLCHGPRSETSDPGWTMPAGAWDTHFHVLGPTSHFPYAANRKYTPPDAPLHVCLEMHDALGIDNGFVVHANTHGFDNRVDLDAVAGSRGRYLAVVRLDGNTTDEECRKLHVAGARGVRFAFNPQHGGALDKSVFSHVMACIKGLGWFVDLHFDGASLPDLEDWIVSIPAPVVIDHIGRIDPTLGLNQLPFHALMRLISCGHVWVKLSGADRISRSGPSYGDVVPFARRLADLAGDRLIWGSDWPHTGYFDSARVPDAGKLLRALAEFVPDQALRNQILVSNPLQLLRQTET